MPSLAATTATPSQQRYIASLRDSRTAEQYQRALSMSAIAAGYADRTGELSVRQASLLIDALVAMPRTSSSASVNGEAVPAPTAMNRAGRMLAAGSLEATVTLLDGRHVTVTIRTRVRSGRGWANGALGEGRAKITVSGMLVGYLRGDAVSPMLSLRTRRPEYVDAIRAVLAYAAGQSNLGANVARVREASRCGRCFRTLTDPVSIERGVGPECFGRSTGSRHVAATSIPRTMEATPQDCTVPVGNARGTVEFNTGPISPVGPTYRINTDGRPELVQPDEASLNYGSAFAEAAAEVMTATVEPQPTTTDFIYGADDIERAQNAIAEALDAYEGEDSNFAMVVFKALAARVQD